jgi:hypothetical protein
VRNTTRGREFAKAGVDGEGVFSEPEFSNSHLRTYILICRYRYN